MSAAKLRCVKPGHGTLAALQHVCPLCAAPQGVRCTTLSGEVLLYVHNKRMSLARAITLFVVLVLGTTLLLAATDDGGGFEAAIDIADRIFWASASLYF